MEIPGVLVIILRIDYYVFINTYMNTKHTVLEGSGNWEHKVFLVVH